MMGTARRAMMVLAVAGFTLGGCDATQLPHATVHGKVTYKGKPLTFGSVIFFPVETPKEGFVQAASGDIQPDGTYILKSQSSAGAVLGDHKVVVYAVEVGGQSTEAKKGEPDAGAAPGTKVVKGSLKSTLPKIYSDPGSTPLTRKVVAGDNTIDLEIKD